MATKGWPRARGKSWSYGAEFELADWDQRKPHRWRTDLDWTMVNSNGIAVDPKGIVYHFGGEVLAEPTGTPSGVAEQMAEFVNLYPETTVNYRSNLHVHVRVPGLRDDLEKLKTVQVFCSKWLPKLLPVIEPIPLPVRSRYPTQAQWRGAMKRYSRRKISHQKIMADRIVERQLMAKTVTEFFEAEALHVESGRLLWATKPRCAVNLRQLMATDTIEFRHFPGTVNPAEIEMAVEWCKVFLEMALKSDSFKFNPVLVFRSYGNRRWPKFQPYVHWMEERYKVTNPHYVGVEAARAAIQEVLS